MKNKDAIRARLLALASANRLTPEAVVREAASPKSVLHGLFKWNDAEAAHAYRLDQAREIISNFEITISISNVEIEVQEFVKNPANKQNESGYVPVTSLRSEPEMAAEFVSQQLSLARTFVEKTRRFALLLGVGKDIDSVSDRLDEIGQSIARKKTKRGKP